MRVEIQAGEIGLIRDNVEARQQLNEPIARWAQIVLENTGLEQIILETRESITDAVLNYLDRIECVLRPAELWLDHEAACLVVELEYGKEARVKRFQGMKDWDEIAAEIDKQRPMQPNVENTGRD